MKHLHKILLSLFTVMLISEKSFSQSAQGSPETARYLSQTVQKSFQTVEKLPDTLNELPDAGQGLPDVGQRLPGAGQRLSDAVQDSVISFCFRPGKDAFLLQGNEAELKRLYALVDKYRAEIANGKMPVYVDGYCTSLPTEKENLNTAYLRANRVKSELITHKGLKEADFVTANHACAHYNNGEENNKAQNNKNIRGKINKDKEDKSIKEKSRGDCNNKDENNKNIKVSKSDNGKKNSSGGNISNQDKVIVTLHIPVKGAGQLSLVEKESVQKELITVPAKQSEQPANKEAELEPFELVQQPEPEGQQGSIVTASEKQPEPVTGSGAFSLSKSYCFAVRTNLLYDVFLLPTLGVEWRISDDFGIKIDGSFAYWGNGHGKVQKMYLLNPEARWYIGDVKRLYLGVSGCYGKYNVYKYLLGSIFSGDTGYQGKLWNAGMTIGYQLHLSRSFSFDFNLGLGYTRSEYDSFRMIDGVRVCKGRDRSKNFWGPTQAGVSFVWTVERKK